MSLVSFKDSVYFGKYIEIRNKLIEEKKQYYYGSPPDLAEILYSECYHFCLKIHEAIPELQLQKGFINSYQEHWWLTYNDEIVDPTIEQFRGILVTYTVFDEAKHDIVIGKCMDCGNKIYGKIAEGTQYFCDEECEKSYNFYLEKSISRK